MPRFDDLVMRLREICRALPDTKVTMTWGTPHFRVGEKIFLGCNDEAGRLTIGFKLDKAHAAELVRSDSRVRIAPYVGKHGWVELDVGGSVDWDEVRGYVLESYRRIAPKRLLARLGLEAPPSRMAPPRAPTKRQPSKRPR